MSTRVMIVDDSLRARMELCNLLATYGFTIVGEAADGQAAVEMFERLKPEITILDARMPDADGVCTTRQILRKDPQAVIVMSASSGERSLVMEALSAGAVDFIAKPFVERKVVRTLRRAIAGVFPQ